MTVLLHQLINIVFLRQGPQDLPPGRSVLLATLCFYVLIAALSLNMGHTPDSPTAVLVLAATLPLLLAWIVLKLKNRVGRWEQTLSALYGTSALLSMITLPLNIDASSEPATPVVLISLLVFLWSFAVDTHIWRNALDLSFAAGLGVAMILFIFTFGIISSVAGPL